MSGKEMKKTSDELFILDGRPSLGQTVPLALQHVVAMIVGCVTPAIIVAGVAGLSEQDSIFLCSHRCIVRDQLDSGHR
ncbi:hypothetical protein [Frisingicoccus sp.]|uniref:hypothetical protein n=1 Tax=Frisingicoccus sp. TaxID=1918627 RepID=UPI002F42E251